MFLGIGAFSIFIFSLINSKSHYGCLKDVIDRLQTEYKGTLLIKYKELVSYFVITCA